MAEEATSNIAIAGTRAGWPALRSLVRALEPALSAPGSAVGGLCVVCRGPAGGRVARCYQCELHMQCAQDGLADVVVPVAFALKGGEHAGNLWRYKSCATAQGAVASQALLRALLLIFLRDHRRCVLRAARGEGPTHLAVVPTARSRPGPHPLRALIAPYLAGPWAELAAAPGERGRDLDPERFVAAPVRGSVLLLDDTWTTGASAQSAAMALRRSGAVTVATVVLGRHVGMARAGAAGSGSALDHAAAPFSQRNCAVHEGA